jgi:hypothetical protein
MFFLDHELVKLGRAFDRAWDRFLRMRMLNAANLSRSQETLAKSILEKANLGVHDEWRLARESFVQLSQAERQFSSRGALRPPPTKPPCAAHSPKEGADTTRRSGFKNQRPPKGRVCKGR